MFESIYILFHNSSLLIFFGIIITVVIHFIIEPVRWAVYLWREKYSLSKLFCIFFATSFFSYILPLKLGLPLRLWMIKRYQKVSIDIACIFMVTDSAVSIILWTTTSILVGADFVVNIFKNNFLTIKYFYLLVFLLFFVIIIALLIINKKKYGKKIFNIRIIFKNLSLYQLLLIVILFAVDIVSYVVRHGLIIIFVQGPYLDWMTVTTITVLSIFAGFASAMPMGLVGYDATIVLLLTQNGMGIESAAAVPVINRVANILVSVLFGIPSTFRLDLGFDIKKIKENLKN